MWAEFMKFKLNIHRDIFVFEIGYGVDQTFILLYYCQTSNISGTLVGYKPADHSDVVGTSPVGAAPTIS